MAVYLFTTTDPEGRTAQLSDDCYRFHISIEHPDITSVAEIALAIEAPDIIAEDAIDNNRLIYYRTYRRRPQRWMLKVVVGRGEVVTAYRVTRIKQGEMVLWQR